MDKKKFNLISPCSEIKKFKYFDLLEDGVHYRYLCKKKCTESIEKGIPCEVCIVDDETENLVKFFSFDPEKGFDFSLDILNPFFGKMSFYVQYAKKGTTYANGLIEFKQSWDFEEIKAIFNECYLDDSCSYLEIALVYEIDCVPLTLCVISTKD